MREPVTEDPWKNWQWPPTEEEWRRLHWKEYRRQQKNAITYLREESVKDRLLDLFTGFRMPHTRANLYFSWKE